MPDAFGYDSSIGWAEEVAWGTGVARALFMPVISIGIKKDVDWKEAANIRGLSERRRYEGMHTVAGPVDMEVLYEGIDEWLKHLFGATGSALTDVTAYKHTHTLADALPPGLSLEGYMGDDAAGTPEAHLWVGCKINSATFTFEPDDPLKVTFEMVGKDESFVTKTAVTFPDLTGALLVKGHEVSCELDDAATSIDSAELTIPNGLLTDKKIMGSKYIDTPVRNSRRIISGTITKDWEDKTLYQKFINGTDIKIELICTSATDVPGSTTPYSLAFILPKARFIGETPGVSDASILKQPLPFVGLSTGTGTSDSIYCEVVNALTAV